MKKILVAALALALSGFSCAFANEDSNVSMNKSSSANNQSVSLKNTIVSVPAGISFKAVFLAPISSAYAYTGQEITLALGRDFYYNGNVIAPVGSTVTGTVIDVAKAKHGALNGKLTLRFTHIITPNGDDIPISAVIKTDDSTGTLYGGKKWDMLTEYNPEHDDYDKFAIARTIVPPSVRSVVRGNVIMPELGSGGGLVKSIWDKGTDVEIPVNSPMDLILIQPVTARQSSF